MTKTLLASASVALVMAGSSFANPVNFAIGIVDGTGANDSMIQFTGKSGSTPAKFTFVDAIGGAGDNRTFQIVSSSTDPDLLSLYGEIIGTWDIGAVSGTIVQTAPVTAGNPGSFRIYQDATNFIQAAISFIEISTSPAGGNITKGAGSMNLSGWETCSGCTISNAGLLNLIGNPVGEAKVGFTFAPNKTLTQIVNSTTVLSASFNGTVSAVPEPALTASLFAGVVAIIVARRRLQSTKRQ